MFLQSRLLFYLLRILPLNLLGLSFSPGALTVFCQAEKLKTFLQLLAEMSLVRVSGLLDLVAIDTLQRGYRFVVNYVLWSFYFHFRITVAVRVPPNLILPSCTDFFSCGAWLEREVWDMFGILFVGNIDLRRILSDYGFSGHALRRDFPLTGFLEIFYSDREQRIVPRKVVLAQNFRDFYHQNAWLGFFMR